MATQQHAITTPHNGAAVLDRPDSVPEPRDASPAPDAGERPALKRFPYEDGPSAAQYLIHRMPPGEFDKMLGLLLEHQTKRADAAR